MSLCRSWFPALASGLILVGLGCRSAPPKADDPLEETDSFGFATEEDIEAADVERAQMMFQRAQLELKLGGSFPWDLFDPTKDPQQDPGLAIGTKFDFEVSKNLYLGASFDWVRHDVENPSIPPQSPIENLKFYDRYTFLGVMDYDIPLSEDPRPLIVRVGAGAGLLFIDPGDPSAGVTESLKKIYNFVFRLNLGLRYPISENTLVFVEGSYDMTPDRSLVDRNGNRLAGESPIFGTGIIWAGLAFQWH